MSQIPEISQHLNNTFLSKGINGDRAYEVNRLPNFATPRTTAYNLTTISLMGLSAAGAYLVKRSSNYYRLGFSFAFGLTVFLNFLQHRQLDNSTIFSAHSAPSFEQELEKFPVFKHAFLTVDSELNQRISQLEKIRKEIGQ